MNATQFMFRFVRDVEDSSLDDLLKIKSSRSGKTLVLTYKSIDLKNEHVMYFKSVKNLSEYLFAYLSLMKYDDSPFEYVQVDPPVLPSVLFTVENLNYNIRRITSMIELHYDN
jgi:hypothetical protein